MKPPQSGKKSVGTATTLQRSSYHIQCSKPKIYFYPHCRLNSTSITYRLNEGLPTEANVSVANFFGCCPCQLMVCENDLMS